MAISTSGTPQTAANSGTAVTVNLASTAVGDINIVTATQSNGGTPNLATVPSGWTKLGGGYGYLTIYRVFQSGDATSVSITFGTGNNIVAACVAYTGVDTANPIDTHTEYAALSMTRVPSATPNYAGDMLVAIFQSVSSSSNTTPTAPSGLTARAFSGPGPTVYVCDASAGSTPTSTYPLTFSGAVVVTDCLAILLKAAGASSITPAAARPAAAGFNAYSGVSTSTVALYLLNPQVGDLVLLSFSGAASGGYDAPITPPAGYSLLSQSHGTAVCYKTWASGDSLTPTFTASGASYCAVTAFVARSSVIGGANVQVDAWINGYQLVATVPCAIPSLVPAASGELQYTFFSDNSTIGAPYTATPSGMQLNYSNGAGPNIWAGLVDSCASPVGAASATSATTFSSGYTITFSMVGTTRPVMPPTLDGVTASAVKSGVGPATVSGLYTFKVDDIILLWCMYENNGGAAATTSISDTAGLTWTLRKKANINANTNLELWWAHASSVISNDTITINYSGTNDDAAFFAAAFNGCDLSVPFDSNASLPAAAAFTSTSAPSVSGINTSQSPDTLLYAWGSDGNNSNLGTVPSGWSALGFALNSGGSRYASMGMATESVYAAQSGLSATWGTSVTVTSSMETIFDALKAPSGPPAVQRRPMQMLLT